MDEDWGSVDIHRWELNGKPLYVVRTDTDGSDGWLELYDADGTALGYGRTDWSWPVWAAKGDVRRSVFGDDPPGMREKLAEEVNRLRGSRN